MNEQPSATATLRPRVDPGALVLAALAAASAFILGPGEWGVLSLVIGLALLFVIIGHHEPVPQETTWRNWILRVAFASVVGLALDLCIAWALQEWIMKPFFPGANAAENTTKVLSYLWFGFVLLLAASEQRISTSLDRPLVTSRQRKASSDLADASDT
jgi:hypothetical protein